MFADKLKGYDNLWFLGDNFVAHTYRTGYKDVDKKEGEYFTEKFFNVHAYCSSRYDNNETNMLKQIANSFVQAMAENSYLPRFLVMVFDDDIIDFTDFDQKGVSTLFGKFIDFLANGLG